jgi:hypothetical protein
MTMEKGKSISEIEFPGYKVEPFRPCILVSQGVTGRRIASLSSGSFQPRALIYNTDAAGRPHQRQGEKVLPEINARKKQ